MGRKGSQKNEQKINDDVQTRARERWLKARENIAALKAIPVKIRPEDFSEKLREQTGILKKALSDLQKSENHSRKGKGGGR